MACLYTHSNYYIYQRKIELESKHFVEALCVEIKSKKKEIYLSVYVSQNKIEQMTIKSSSVGLYRNITITGA